MTNSEREALARINSRQNKQNRFVNITMADVKKEEKRMKKFMIYDCISNDYVRGMNLEAISIQAGNGKSALQKFLRMYVMSSGMYEFHKRCNRWIMTSTYGSYFVAMPKKED